jgi:hypothetical protein
MGSAPAPVFTSATSPTPTSGLTMASGSGAYQPPPSSDVL